MLAAHMLPNPKPLGLATCCDSRVQQAEYFWDQARDADLGFVRVSGAALALSVHEECLQWTRALAATMKEVDEAAAAALRAKMASMAEALARVSCATRTCQLMLCGHPLAI